MNIAAFPAYDSYKDSGVEWIGNVPSNWSVERGKWLFIKKDRPVRAEDDIVTCFRDGEVTLRSNRRTDGFTNALKEHGYQGIRKGDLVIHAMDAFAGAIGVSDSDGKATPVYSACAPRKNNTADPKFYAYYIRNIALSGLLLSLAKGIRERSTDFRYNDFADLALAVPSLAEQRAITLFLDEKCAKIDEAVRIKEDQIALLRERRQILIQQTVTRGLNPDAPMKDSGIDWIGKIPSHWDVRRGKYLFAKISRPVGSKDEIVTCFRDGEVTLRSNRRTEGFTTALKEHGYQGIRKGDLVIHAMDAFAGAIGVSDSDGKATPVYSVCIPRSGANVEPSFFAQLMRQIALSGLLVSIAKGIRERSTDFRYGDFADLWLAVPPLSEQMEIVDFIRSTSQTVDEGIAIKEDQIAALKNYKTSLINAAVTGKIKVA